MEAREILELVKNGSMSVEEAEGFFRRQPFEDMGYAKLDLHRRIRSGFPEVIFCSGKPDEFLINIFQRMAEKEGQAFGTRATAEQYEMVRKVIPDIQYDPVSRILKLERTPKEKKGLIAVVTGGTLAQRWNGSTMSESAGSIGFSRRRRGSRRPTALLRWPAWRARWQV